MFYFKKSIRCWFFIVFIISLGICLSNFTKQEIYQKDFSSIVYKQVNRLSKEIDLLVLISEKFQKKELSKKDLQNQLQVTRYAFKRAEGVLTYYYPKHIQAYINGAPLPHPDPFPIKKNAPDYYVMTPEAYKKSLPLDMLDLGHYSGKPRVAAPEGLQTLDELIFSEDNIDSQKIVRLTTRLQRFYIPLEKHIKNRKFFYDFELLEASRLELIRVFSMGVTGFDTPGSLNAITEVKHSLKGVEDYINLLKEKCSLNSVSRTDRLFYLVDEYLQKHQEFESFDRLAFLKDYVDPLYAQLGEIKEELNLTSTANKYGEVSSWNTNSTSIFSEELLNPYYYSFLKEEEDSAELRNLGKKLFYDDGLSKNENLSCASCHQPELAFTDGKVKSFANLEGETVKRNSPSLINAVFSDRFFYDLRAHDLEDQVGHVIDNHLEYNTNFKVITEKLENNSDYINLFSEVFPEQKINRYQFSKALSSYVISLRSFNTPFDQYVRGEKSNISVFVKRGFNLFMGKAACATCHFPPTFSGLVPPLFQENESEVIGVLTSPNVLEIDKDLGRYENGIYEDKLSIYKHSFKTTTVREANYTAPYFHNGSYSTLEEVIDFYDKGGASGMGLINELPNQTLAPDPLELTNREKKDLISFIKSLSTKNY
ncbi:cytochrome c peroxidase [Mesonia phycicola]|uniref:Cytochrome c peroxidase n=1 Tax=Mesonia phycicola TaxID=579105 RepID=A0A1M6FNM2_9FLAO|nr:cytochrome-c peroxidase [Mesonia phycicola]SHI99280.1 cytochrome c peroxidase [Mesonia phycicola]